jgi:hypothetical protein
MAGSEGIEEVLGSSADATMAGVSDPDTLTKIEEELSKLSEDDVAFVTRRRMDPAQLVRLFVEGVKLTKFVSEVLKALRNLP